MKMRNFGIGLFAGVLIMGQTPPATPTPAPGAPPAAAPGGRGARPQAPARDPHTPGYVTAKELPDGTNPSPKEDGNFIMGPTHAPAPEMTVKEDVLHGEIFNFVMESADSKFYPGIAREPGPMTPDPNDPTKMLIKSSPKPYTRKVAVYVPKQYVKGTVAPFIVGIQKPCVARMRAAGL